MTPPRKMNSFHKGVAALSSIWFLYIVALKSIPVDEEPSTIEKLFQSISTSQWIWCIVKAIAEIIFEVVKKLFGSNVWSEKIRRLFYIAATLHSLFGIYNALNTEEETLLTESMLNHVNIIYSSVIYDASKTLGGRRDIFDLNDILAATFLAMSTKWFINEMFVICVMGILIIIHLAESVITVFKGEFATEEDILIYDLQQTIETQQRDLEEAAELHNTDTRTIEELQKRVQDLELENLLLRGVEE